MNFSLNNSASSVANAGQHERAAEAACPLTCKHCGLPLPSGSFTAEFCCRGCEAVFSFLHAHGLEGFYERRVQEGALSASPVALSSHRFAYLDDPKIDAQYVEKEGALATATFHLRGLHCGACVWLIERLPSILPGVMSARVRFADGVALVQYPCESIRLSAIASAFEHLGYAPSIMHRNDVHSIRTAAPATLARLGVAAVSASNAMMLAVSIYQGWFSGMEAKYEIFLSWMSLFVSLPSMLYSAIPFCQRAIASLRSRALHIDVPISLALVIGFLVSAWNTFQGSGHIYYDSLTVLVFLLLAARFTQERTLQRRVKGITQASALPMYARKLSASGTQVVFSGAVKAGDELLLEPGDVVPVDGEVILGSSSVDAAILSGESRPIPVEKGSPLFAGTKNLIAPIHFIARTTQTGSRFGTLLRQIEDAGSKSILIDRTNALAGKFVAAILVTTVLSGLAWYALAGLPRAVDVILSVLVVTCPCALGMAAPLTITFASRRAASVGILMRGQDAIERIATVDRVVLDKTGTVTNGTGTVSEFWCTSGANWSRADTAACSWLGNVRAAEEATRHPSGQAILRFLEGVNLVGVESVSRQEFPGRGISAQFADGTFLQIGSARWMNELGFLLPSFLLQKHSTAVFVADRAQVLGCFLITDEVRPGMADLVSRLHLSGKKVSLLSGDRSDVAHHVAELVGIPRDEVFAEQSPEEKEQRILTWAQTGKPAMVGDGVNDALALRAAVVGIGMSGGAEITLRVADCYLLDPSSAALRKVFSGSSRAVRAIRRNILVSLCYNLLGGTLAVLGYINPLVAALIMPLSSLSVLLVATSSRTFGAED